MRVDIYSRKDMEELLNNSNFPIKTAVISFYDPKADFHDKDYAPVEYEDKTDRVFYVPLHDIDIEILDCYGFTYDTFFPEVQDLAKFILDVKADGYRIICQCEYGQSRSAGCAAAIREFFHGDGIRIFANYNYYPNQVVYNKVFEALLDENEKRKEYHAKT